jgi:uncharacterized protein (TIRG00374 family)
VTRRDVPTSAARRAILAARYVVAVALGVAVLVALYSQRGDFTGALRRTAHANPWWSGVAVVAEGLSLVAYAALQGRVLAAGATHPRFRALVAITLANDALALTVPGEIAFASLFRYRQYRERGASEATAGWTVLTLMVAQAIGLSALLFIAVLVSLVTSTSAGAAGAAVVGLVIVVGAGVVLARRDGVVHLLDALVRASRRVSGHPRGDLAVRVEGVLENMRAYEISPRDKVVVLALALAAWCFDLACLVSAFAAVGEPAPWHGLLLAYGAAQIVAVLPIVPGGLGLMEGSLAVILVGYGATRVAALAAVLVYRLVSYWLAVVVGWSTFVVMVVRRRRARGATAPSDGALAEDS